ncbi:MAG: nitrilase-related carbon-nitrogen hydrolase [Phycisphaerae bacterium]
MRVIGVQLDIAWHDKAANCAAAAELIAGARPPTGSLIVLPEMFATGFSMDVPVICEDASGPAHAFLAETAREYRSFVLGGVAARAEAGRGANEAVVFDPDGAELARYRKMHPFSYARETEHFDAGERVVTFGCGDFTAAAFICYDLRFPEAFRAAVGKGVDLLAVIANWPAAREQHWLALLTARAVENQAYVVGVNRVGSDPNNEYNGRSVVISPTGEVVADAGCEQAVLQADLDPANVREFRESFPALKDIRPSLMPPRE